MNRTALGLAIGAGYLLGRTKKLKMALAVGSVVAGKKLNLTPRGIGDLLQQQLRDNPQFKEIGDQLRQDMRGVGKAATGAMAERQLNALADRLHGRTADVRDRLSGVAPGDGSEDEEPRQDTGDDEPRDDVEDEDTSGGRRGDKDRSGGGQEDEGGSEARREERPRKKAAQKAPAKKTSAGSTAKKAASKAPARKAGAARKTAAKKTASAGSGRSRQAKGGDDR
ncbi:DNA primase [Streptomyces collinus]|uniref:DNA primase n=1 Tax=Streptomyces collinus TaxID=42684 RepID=UPI00368A46C6